MKIQLLSGNVLPENIISLFLFTEHIGIQPSCVLFMNVVMHFIA